MNNHLKEISTIYLECKNKIISMFSKFEDDYF